jgi:hypothetical protein
MIDSQTKAFIEWLHDPKCVFHTHFNGLDKTKPRISYKKGDRDDKEYTIDEVFAFYESKI